MNKVSWRRILQRAGHEFPNGGVPVPTQDAPPTRDGRNLYNVSAAPRPALASRRPEPGILESELKRALDRAAQRDHEPAAAGTPPGWEPIFMARELNPTPPVPQPRGAAMLREVPRKATVPAMSLEAPEKRSGSGTRNIIAISLSVAVVGIALQQIGTQWNESRSGGGVRAVPEVADATAPLQTNAETDETQLAYGVRPATEEPRVTGSRISRDDRVSQDNRISQDDRISRDNRVSQDNSIAQDNRVSQDKSREAFMQEVEQAASVLAAPAPKPRPQVRQASVTPAIVPAVKEPVRRGQDAEAISRPEEESMLRRAHDLMERGHVTGARLIFEHLALRQSALGAFALAQTYDEKFLKKVGAQGLAPDQKLAAKWYRRAAELGSQAADRN